MRMSKNKSRKRLPFYGLLAILIFLFGIVIGLTPLQAPDKDKAKPSEVSFESTWGFLENKISHRNLIRLDQMNMRGSKMILSKQ
ncbi:hypothetical protein ACA29_00540 [Lederbergia galactosidilytica]|uniref:Uncharacterized protein n=1 Tax=Lederbergia galactosidilytica TaxID=217031 RepID=A0A0Q9Y8H6_9BACI|nr:hypothetical protein ACA29_00540 [Lederbergia galactosidilytica]